MKTLKGNVKLKLMYIVLLCILLVFCYFLYFNNTIPFTDGWGIYYVKLIEQGKFPYKDFYYYLPPVNLFIDKVFWEFSGGLLIIYRLYRLIERLFMLSLLFMLLSKFAQPFYAFCATFFGGVLGTAVVYDLMGDYNQTAELFIIITCYFVIKYIEYQDQKRKFLFLAFIGFMISATFLLKQSTGVALGIIYCFIYFIYSYLEKNKNFFKEVLCVCIGVGIPLIICTGILIHNNAFYAFIEQVFLNGSNSKGGLYTILVSSILCWFTRYPELSLFLNLVIIGLWFWLDNKNKFSKKIRVLMWASCTLLCIINIYNFYTEQIYSLLLILKNYFYIFLLFIAFIGILSYFLKKAIKNVKAYETLLFCIINILSCVLIYVNINDFSISLNSTNVFSLLSNAVIILTLLLIIGIIICIVIIKRNPDNLNAKYALMLLSAGLISSYAAQMASSSEVPAARPLFIIVPVLLTIFFMIKTKKEINRVKNIIILITCMIASTIVYAQKYTCSYAWWGWSEEPFYSKTESVNIRGLEGFKLSENQKNIYINVCKLIEMNTDKDDIVWGFPHIKIFNILTDRIGDPGFVPVPFYDVCGDKYAKEEANLLNKNSPEIVIWCDIPGCIETHEAVYRNGEEIGQREIVRWFSKAVSNEKYKIIGQVGNLFIYKKSDGTSINYTYFENKEQVNSTLDAYK